jgi:hypothetical protein
MPRLSHTAGAVSRRELRTCSVTIHRVNPELPS